MHSNITTNEPWDTAEYEDDFDRWYVDVVQAAELADDAPVRGCKVIRPYGYAIWEQLVAKLDRRLKATGVENAYFPLLIPQSLLAQEADHVAGFTPEVAWVTRGGGQELAEPLAIRPTSEAIVGPVYARWVQSYRDLPIVLNQWNSVVRWEERPRPFLRTLEFLWQEGHTCHATAAEADERSRAMLAVYRSLLEEEFAIPVVAGTKTETEKFAGAVRTYTVEAMMGGKFWALQSGTSHNLGDHFARAYGIRYLDRDGERRYAHSTSWGLSHRVLGAMVMVHGDGAGLKLPPRVAPIQVVIVPIQGRGGTGVEKAAARAEALLASVTRVRTDRRDDRTAGAKYHEWERKGVPVRVEIGPRDVAADQAVLVRRDIGKKQTVPLAGLEKAVVALLDEIQAGLLATARRVLAERTAAVVSFAELTERAAANAGWSLAHWCGDAECEARIKAETKATIRCVPFDRPDEAGACVVCGRTSPGWVVVARAY